jgi:hypothetical protein
MLQFEGLLLKRNRKDQSPPFYQEERLQPVQAVLVEVWGEHNSFNFEFTWIECL